MAYDKVVDSAVLDANLKSVADAIRTASGATGNLAFPSGYVSALQNMKMVAEVHKVTLSADVTGAKEQVLLSGNDFIKKHYNNAWFSVVLYADSPSGAAGVVPFSYQGNRKIGASNTGIGCRYTSASAVGNQGLTANISAEGWGQHMRVNSSGKLGQYLHTGYILKAGTYTIVLISAEE
jgi:hypothetical protein